MPKKGLSDTDIRVIAAFARNAAKAPRMGKIVSEAFETLKTLTGIKAMRIVYSPRASAWKEWKTTLHSLEVRDHDEWPAPDRKDLTMMFDPESDRSGYVSINRTARMNGKAHHVLSLLTPEVWSATLLESALRRVQKASISEAELARETLRARDEERRHIARELHDDLGQSLASLKLALKWAEDAARPKSNLADVADELSAARANVGTMLNKIRDLSHTLYPRILDSLGLASAIKELTHQISRHSGIKTQCTIRGKEPALDKDIGLGLYRCFQEAASNVIRHAEASRLNVVIRFAAKEVHISVEDNGKGFDPRSLYDSNAKLMSSGFWTIRQRMADLGGAFRLSTACGKGAAVEMIVPYSGKKYGRKDKTLNRR